MLEPAAQRDGDRIDPVQLDLMHSDDRREGRRGHANAGFTLRVYARDARDPAAVVADVLTRAESAGVGS